MTASNRPDGYEVGFKSPPKAHQFKPGVSGNPKGRPRQSLDFDQQVLKEFETLVTVQENGRQIKISKRELMIKQALHQAIKGNSQILRLSVASLMQALERKKQREAHIASSGPLNEKILTMSQLNALLCCHMTASQLQAAEGMSAQEAEEYINDFCLGKIEQSYQHNAKRGPCHE